LDLSGLECASLAGKLDSTLGGYYVNNIYLTGSSTLLLKLHRSDKPELSLVMSPRIGAWLTTKELPRAAADQFTSDLRSRLLRAKFSAAKAPEGERMIEMSFTLADQRLSLVGEFFGAGNAILLDSAGSVLACLNSLEVRERIIRQGLPYKPPPPRSIPLSRVDIEYLRKTMAADEPAERLLGRGVALARRIVEEALRRASIAKGTRGSSLAEAQLLSLESALGSIATEARSSRGAYLYSRGDEPEELSCVRLNLGTEFKERAFDDMMEAMDLVFTPRVVEGLASESVKAAHDDLKKLETSISSKKEELAGLHAKSAKLREVASSLMAGTSDYDAVAAALSSVSRSYQYEPGTGVWSFDGRRFKVETPYALASQVFGEGKEADAAFRKLEEAITKLEKRREELAEMIGKGREVSVATRQRRERKWFEKFRWFYTSDDHFAIGGRDAGSNSLLVRRHLEPADLVFHTEIPGSAFFVLKGGQAAGEDGIRETAEAVVSYSRAWREGLTSADAYYVRPEQVLKGAPSGQYLPRGSFVIQGERTYVKGIELRVSVGVGRLDGEQMLFSGPPSALVRRCGLIIEMVPGHLPTPEAAKKLKRELSEHLEGEDKAFVEGLHLDEFVKALPTGKLRQLRILKGDVDSQGGPGR
jgi:predicted ribosome quality control (RQC) complex YloA/Tae2 family protein